MFRTTAASTRTILALALAAAAPLMGGCSGQASDVPSDQDTQAVRSHADRVPLKRYFFVRNGNHFAALFVQSQVEAIDSSPAQVQYTVTNWNSDKKTWEEPQKKSAVAQRQGAVLDAGDASVGWSPGTAAGTLSAVSPPPSAAPSQTTAPSPATAPSQTQVALCNLDDITNQNPTTRGWHYGYL